MTTTYTISNDIKRKVAEAIVKESAPGYNRRYYGQRYIADTDGDLVFDSIYFKSEHNPWAPWPNSATVISIEKLYSNDDTADYDPTPEDPDHATQKDVEEAKYEALLLAMQYMPAQFTIKDT